MEGRESTINILKNQLKQKKNIKDTAGNYNPTRHLTTIVGCKIIFTKTLQT